MRGLLFGGVAGVVALSSVGAEIAIPDAATPVERTAAEELASGLRRVTGVAYDVRTESAVADAAYFVGETRAARRLAETNGWGRYEPDEIRRGTVDGKVVLGVLV